MHKSSIEFRQLEQKPNRKVKLRLTTSAQIAAILMLAAGLSLSSCEMPKEYENKVYNPSNNVLESKLNNPNFSIVIIDSCEYVVYSQNHFSYSAHSSGITHKGNCKYCLTRKK